MSNIWARRASPREGAPMAYALQRPRTMLTLPRLYVVRHGETSWSRSGQHTGRTDLPITARGEALARRLRSRLAALAFATVLTSPLRRAARTCALAGFGSVARPDADLLECEYGAYEGRRTADIHAERPGVRAVGRNDTSHLDERVLLAMA